MNKVFLGIGTNLGDREDNLRGALQMIEEKIGVIFAKSKVYETEPWGFETESLFLNMVVGVETKLSPKSLLERILMTEAFLGRLREGRKYCSRLIDIDILFYDNRVIDMPELQIPHPRIPERRFTLVPLCDLSPDYVHPVLNKTLAQLLDECKDKGRVSLYKAKP